MPARTTVETSQVRGRCRRRFESYDDILAEVRSLAARPTRQLGNWSLGQICRHLGTAMELSTTADEAFPVALHMRILGRLIRNRALKKGIPSGFKLPPEGAAVLVSPEVSVEEGLAALERGIAALGASTRRTSHPVFGKLNAQQWEQFHLRHAEMHLSFIVPDDEPQ